MNFSVPDYVPIPSSETLFVIYIVLAIVGVCAIVGGCLWLFLCKRHHKKTIAPWACIGVGVLLAANHGIQLLMKLS